MQEIKCSSDIKNIFYINLDKRVDRKIHIENQLKLVNWSAHRFPAIIKPFGAIGCSLSHLALLKYARENNLDHILILEDDASFLNPSLFLNNLNQFLKTHTNFDVLLLAGNNVGNYERIDDCCVKVSQCQVATAYLVKNHYYDTLIENFENGINLLQLYPDKYCDYAIDQFWKKLQKIHNWFLLTPLSVVQRPGMSDIAKQHSDYQSDMLDLDKGSYLIKKKPIKPIKPIKTTKTIKKLIFY
jgi:GR25 family glycosyltransferase involved in LPS biosynthesis